MGRQILRGEENVVVAAGAAEEMEMVGQNWRRIVLAMGTLMVAGMLTMAATPAGTAPQSGEQAQAASAKAPKKAKAPKASKADRLKASAKSININTASAEDLTALPRIGTKVAQRIVEYRTAHKGFKSVDELRNVKGVGPKLLEGIKPYVAL